MILEQTDPLYSILETTDSLLEPSSTFEKIDFLRDAPRTMTYGRRLALWLIERYPWYSISNSAEASLEKAWAFFEHVTLPRYVLPQNRNDPLRENARSPKNEKNTRLHKRILRKLNKGDRQLNIAEPGEDILATKLYSPLNTPLSQLGDFGLGYGLYFATVRGFAVLLFLAGLIHLPVLLHYASDTYSGGQEGVKPFLKGSAICTDTKWVPCPTCELKKTRKGTLNKNSRVYHTEVPAPASNFTGDWLNVTQYRTYDENGTLGCYAECYVGLLQDHGIEMNFNLNRYYVKRTDKWYEYDTNNYFDGYTPPDFTDWYLKVEEGGDTTTEWLGMGLKNQCEGPTHAQGYANTATVVFLLLGIVVIRVRLKRLEVAFDEDEQTAQDYSVVILNPPADARDPQEWKAFFEQTFSDVHVTVCTVDIRNDEIVKLLLRRREILHQLQHQLPADTPLDSLDHLHNIFVSDTASGAQIPSLVADLLKIDKSISENFAKMEKHSPSNVFVTFEKQSDQRRVLSELCLGSLAVYTNNVGSLRDPRYLFRGTHVLNVKLPEEPTTIRWQELHASDLKMTLSVAVTSIITVLFILAVNGLLLYVYGWDPFFGGIANTLCTSLFPMVATKLMNLEYHYSETTRQKWLFLRIAIFNIFTTTVLLAVLYPFTETLENTNGSHKGLIPTVYGLLFSQLLISPFLQVLDLGGNFHRHILAPRAKTQEHMNMHMLGSEVYLAERYANLIKFIFLVCWYCALFPAGFFLGSFALIIIYFTDRFSLMRSWSRSPQVGASIADFVRRFFISAAILAMAVVSANSWAGFPYDNLCEDNNITDLNIMYIGEWEGDIFHEEDEKNQTFLGYQVYTAKSIKAKFNMTAKDRAYKYCDHSSVGNKFPSFSKYQGVEMHWMTSEQEDVTDLASIASLVVLSIFLIYTAWRLLQHVREYFQSTYKPRGTDQKICFSKVKAIDTYIPQIRSFQFPYPLILCDIEGLDENLFNWNDPDRPRGYYDLTNDARPFLERNNLKVSDVFSTVRHWPPTAAGQS